MKKTFYEHFLLIVRYGFLAFSLVVTGCMPMLGGPQFQSSMATISEAYKFNWETDYKKWSSGLYADLYVDKFIVVDGYYRTLPTYFTATMQGKNWIDIIIAGKPQNIPSWNLDKLDCTKGALKCQQEMIRKSQEMSQEYSSNISNAMMFISATAPLSMRDQVFELKPDQPIRVYGTVQRFGGVGFGSVSNSYTISSSLALVIQKIEIR